MNASRSTTKNKVGCIVSIYQSIFIGYFALHQKQPHIIYIFSFLYIFRTTNVISITRYPVSKKCYDLFQIKKDIEFQNMYFYHYFFIIIFIIILFLLLLLDK